nr:hypothetical protein [Colwellia maritima]
MCCDIVIASNKATLGDAHSNFGVFPGLWWRGNIA